MNAWRVAAKELGIRVEIPFSLASVDGRNRALRGACNRLGGPNGIVVWHILTMTGHRGTAKEWGILL